MECATASLSNFDPFSRRLRAVLVPLQADPQQSRKTLAHVNFARNAGAMIAVVIGSEDQRASANLISDDDSENPELAPQILSSIAPDELARACSDHDPGNPVHSTLEISDREACLSQAHQILLRRAFFDFSKITIQSLKGGRSLGASVWCVTGMRDGARCQPFAVKAGPRRQIKEEIAAVRRNVAEFVPFPHFPPLVEYRCVEGSREALIVGMFVERAIRLDQYLTLDSPSMAISALWDGPLRTWRSNRHDQEEIQLAEEYRRCGVIPRADKAGDLVPAFEWARGRFPEVLAPQQTLQLLADTPKLSVAVCLPHGDLHARNIFVRRNSLDVVLIDFASSKNPSPSGRDPACLEVGIAFDVRDVNGNLLPESSLQEIFNPPILARRPLDSTDGRIESIQLIRSRVAGEGISAAEYQISLACYLLRFARFPPEVGRDTDETRNLKGLAYQLATKLIGAN